MRPTSGWPALDATDVLLRGEICSNFARDSALVLRLAVKFGAKRPAAQMQIVGSVPLSDRCHGDRYQDCYIHLGTLSVGRASVDTAEQQSASPCCRPAVIIVALTVLLTMRCAVGPNLKKLSVDVSRMYRGVTAQDASQPATDRSGAKMVGCVSE
jgi:hypothetical protein